MVRRIVAALLLLLVGGWLFVPTGIVRPAAACQPTAPMPATASPSPRPNFTPPPATAAPSPLPATPTITPEQRLSQLVESSQVVVMGTIRHSDRGQVLFDVEAYTKTNQMTSTLTITTYRQFFDTPPGACEPEWQTEIYSVVPTRFQGARMVIPLDTYANGLGVAVIGKSGRILLVDKNQLLDLDGGKSFGSVDQLDSWRKPGAASAQPPPSVRTRRWQPWMWIPAALAAAGLALLTLGLILKRHHKT
jgi:hypothetical protein